MGVTVHFADSETLHMISSALACRCFTGWHTGDAIGRMLAKIFEEFGIAKKVQNVVTDNASNFAKAFTLFQPSKPVQTSSVGSSELLPEGENDAESLINVEDVEALLNSVTSSLLVEKDMECSDSVDEAEKAVPV
jgi:hypothetical protein